ncbi:DUF2218 domain-containing protein [Rhodobacter capsulatus]|uniref:DUF2218 domain-containing protein n=1 Tax=Rhodobacter capsulatus TaxID=1061 RepID=UPI0003D2DF4A|nr:DUF2218 domain-containing protein [Rhodobacter capsulatus]ETD77948.1 2,4-dihydroxyhept-2-ene-1,7-dioic acid aldolase [Rhodobacter capsulatus B6]
MFVTTARFATPHAAKYIAQLCKHFAHKVPADWDEGQGQAALPSGPVSLRAEADALLVRITAEDAKAMIQSRFVVDSHLVTFAHREGFTGLQWQIEAAPAEAG